MTSVSDASSRKEKPGDQELPASDSLAQEKTVADLVSELAGHVFCFFSVTINDQDGTHSEMLAKKAEEGSVVQLKKEKQD